MKTGRHLVRGISTLIATLLLIYIAGIIFLGEVK